MFPRGHAGVGMLVGAVTLPFASTPLAAAIGFVAVVAGSIAPDVDLVGHPPLSLIRHRGVTHSVWAVFVVGCGAVVSTLLFDSVVGPALVPHVPLLFVLGYISHIVADIVTYGGVFLFHTGGDVYDSRRIQYPVVSGNDRRVNNGLFVAGFILSVTVAFLV